MFYLGEYDEETAKEIKSYLDKAGLKVETRSCLVMEEETTYTIKDKLSAVKELIEDSEPVRTLFVGTKERPAPGHAREFRGPFLKRAGSAHDGEERQNPGAL